MKVFVVNQNRNPLMPCSPRKARLLIKSGAAKVIRRTPFTIQLIHMTAGYKQDLTLGLDPGFEKLGVSIVSEKEEVFSVEVKLRTDVSKKVSNRKMYRMLKRNRLRYRKPRFLNRRKRQSLAPSVKQKANSHVNLVNLLESIAPINKTIIETNSFDPRKLKNPAITGKEYQRGEQSGYENVKAYVLSRDGHKCQAGKKGCVKKLTVHHIQFKSNGGSDKPDNLITLCNKHHKQLHDGKLTLDLKKPKSLRSATIMNIVCSQLNKRFPEAIETFGYITKAKRHQMNLEKTHATDAFIIAGGSNQPRLSVAQAFYKRKNNRCLQKHRKGYAPAIRRQRYKIQPYDLIKYNGKLYKTTGVHNKGASLRLIDGSKKISKSTKHIGIIYHQKTLIYKHISY